jgi:hypothetical protein
MPRVQIGKLKGHMQMHNEKVMLPACDSCGMMEEHREGGQSAKYPGGDIH